MLHRACVQIRIQLRREHSVANATRYRRHDYLKPYSPIEVNAWRTLRGIFDNPEYSDRNLVDIYDYLNRWTGRIRVLVRRGQATDHFKCLNGKGRACAENVNGTSGWADVKDAYNAKKPTAM